MTQNIGTQNIGLLGVGVFATYFVKGLRKGGNADTIYLSPRGADGAEKLSRLCDCTVLESNQQVIDRADIIVVCVSPHHFDALSKDICIPDTKIVISVMAGVTLHTLKSALNLQNNVYRTFPLSCAELGQGFVPVFPSDNPAVNTLLQPLGNVYKIDKESDFDAGTVASCLAGSFYFFYDTLIEWFVKQGYDPDFAKVLVLDNIIGSANFAKMCSESPYAIGAKIAVDGTYTRAGLEQVTHGGGLDAWIHGLDTLKHKLDTS